ncbi:MAG: hypothetical protein R3C42_08780 [Parvularculaceae bacterium]
MAGVALHRIDLDGMEIVGEERYLLGERVRDVRVGPDSRLCDDGRPERRAGRQVLRITPAN